MGKKIFSALIVAVVAMFAGYNIYQSQNTAALSDLALANVEALAEDYEIGGWGTNWKTYTTQCTITNTVHIGISCGIEVGCSHETSYTVTKDVCGKGDGWCMSMAGC